MAVIDVAELTVCEAAGVPLKLTVAPLTKLVPVIAIDVAPVVGPEVGLTAVTGVVTVTSIPPATTEAGDVAVIVVALTNEKVAELDPNITVVAPVKLVPVIV